MRTHQAIIALFAILLPACTSEPAQDPEAPNPRAERSRFPPADVTAIESQTRAPLTLRPGQTLEIRLEGNVTIDPPVDWTLAATPANLRPAGTQVLSADPQADGAGATWLFRFTAAGEGRGTLIFTGGESGRQARFEIVTGSPPASTGDTFSSAPSAPASGPPARIGECADTRVEQVGSRLEEADGRPVPESGSAIRLENGVYGVSYESVPAVDASRPGDPVRTCLVAVPQGCPPGDDRGREYRTTNRRTGRSWTLPDAQHMCGGA